MVGSKGLSAPGNDEDEKDEEDSSELFTGADVTLFRGLAARLNYLSMDRPDLQYAAKEVCREMSKPVKASLKNLFRIGGHLIDHPRLIWNFMYQDCLTHLTISVDANWAGCRRTRKSTSGGTAKVGRHLLKTWSKTQALIARSSGESELYGCVRGSCEGLGLQSLYTDLGMNMDVKVLLDANAATGIVERRGLCKVRHIDTANLWLQQAQARRLLPLEKAPGDVNTADLMTNHIGETDIIKLTKLMDLEMTTGRSNKAAQLHSLDFKKTSLTGDSWDARGAKGTWRRCHSTWRRCLFTPTKVPGGPPDGRRLTAKRHTQGIRRDGSRFEIWDSWRSQMHAHQMLDFEWRGHTTFFDKADGLFVVE